MKLLLEMMVLVKLLIVLELVEVTLLMMCVVSALAMVLHV
jgi:hypothetical protein